MKRYAENTTVSAGASVSEIFSTLTTRYGADQVGILQEGDNIGVQFRLAGYKRTVKIVLPLPDIAFFALTDTGLERTVQQAQAAYDKEVRRLWRAVLLVIKAKMELVGNGADFDREWLGYLALPDGTTVGDLARANLVEALEHGPALLLARMQQAALPTRKDSN